MGNALSESPIIFVKPTHSLEPMNDNVISLSGKHGEVNCEAELVLHIGKEYERGIRVDELVDKFTIGIDFTYRAVLNEVKKKGQPWLAAKGFRSSCTIGDFREISSENALHHDFKLMKNGETLQVGNVKNMIYSLETLIEFVAENYGLGKGDLIYTGTPEGIGKLQHNDVLEIQSGEETLGSCQIALLP
jgi:2-keto-4-pentenoate hydratase/2-oxohepta-3-ene-1,7-dioic acid hydratase in catechol pathway